MSIFGLRSPLLGGALLLLAAGGGRAQFALPGAIAPAPEGSVAAPADTGRAKPKALTPIAPKPPSEDTIVGRALHQDGAARGSIQFQRRDGALEVAHLSLGGDRLTRSGETCRIDVSEPLKLTPEETASGLRRYRIVFPACPFSFDALDGAILVDGDSKVCELSQADCRADPNGLWGMGAAEFDAKRAEETLALRARVDQTVRNDFKALYDKISADKARRKQLVREQAGFSARREQLCRSYVQEADFGYCALRVTEARAITLGTLLAKGARQAAEGGGKSGKNR